MFSTRRISVPHIKLRGISPISRRFSTSKQLWRLLKILLVALACALLYWVLSVSMPASKLSYSNFRLDRNEMLGATLSPWIGGGSVLTSPEGYEKPSTRKTQKYWSKYPDVVHLAFEEAVNDIELEGWEDEWFSAGKFDVSRFRALHEPTIDFVYNWVNGSDTAFNDQRHEYELKSPLNDAKGKWISQHGINRYRDWDELRYSFRSLDLYARGFINKIQVLVNSVRGDTWTLEGDKHPQRPSWLRSNDETEGQVEVLPQEFFFGPKEQSCLPTFNSLSIESQLHLTPSSTDFMVALSDDMFLSAPHTAADFHSPLFGATMAFKTDHYNTKALGSKETWPSFGEKPFAYYTSFLLNRRFGNRNRNIQVHHAHAVRRSVLAEVMQSFPGPAAHGACERFRGESSAQLYPWYAAFHYSIERFREVLLWSYIMFRADANGDGYLDWEERQALLSDIRPGVDEFATGQDGSMPAKQSQTRERMYYRMPEMLRRAGLSEPLANDQILWTSLDGPATIAKTKCHKFKVDKCLGEAFGSAEGDARGSVPEFSAASVLSRVSRENVECGDCLVKFLLEGTPRGLGPLLPPNGEMRQVVLKALKKYQHVVVDGTEKYKFAKIRDGEQAEQELLKRTIKQGKTYAQWCVNDDVTATDDEKEIERVWTALHTMFETLWPDKGRWEL